MKCRAIRSFAALLIAVFAVSLLPTSYANATASFSQDSSSQSRTRRGKNGDPAKSTPVQPANQDQPDASQTGQRTAGPVKQTTRDSSARPNNSQPSMRDRQTSDEQAPAEQADQPSRASQGKEPPPFDRPPISSTTRNQPTTEPTARAPQEQPSNSRGNQTESPRYDTQRNPQSAPTLKRERDSDADPSSRGDMETNPAERNDRDRPVLRRPTDTADPNAPRSQPRTSNRPTTANPQDGASTPEGSQDDEVIRLESTLVNIPLLVSDRSGRFIPRLNQNDFQLYEDGVQQEITSFTSEEVPFNVVLLLDMSPSVQGSTDEIQNAAIAFVRQLRPQDRVMVATFDRQVQYLTDFTSDRRMLESAIRSVSTGSGTSVYDAVYTTISQRFRNIEGRKALILFSDGEDTTSNRADYDDAVEVVTESDVLVYGLRYPGGGGFQTNPWPRDPWPQIQLPFPWPWPRRRRGPFKLTGSAPVTNNATGSAPQWSQRRGRNNGDFMTDITAAGGGPVYDAEKIGDLSGLANKIAEELRHTYTLSYYPTNKLSNGGYRSIRIRVRTRDDLAVRHRKGYNAGDNNRPSRTD